MDEIGAKQFDELRDRRSQQAGSNDGLRRTSRTRKVPREYAEYLNEIHSKGLKHELLKLSQIIDLLKYLQTIDQLNKSIHSLERDSKFENGLHLKDDDKLSVSVQSSVSMSRSSKSRRSGGSSVSSMVKTAARSAELARLKLEQAERRAKTKEKQVQEQIERELQDLREQAEYSQLEAELFAADQADERHSDCGNMRSLSKAVAGNRVNMK
ncbi:Hypothetical predicted protein, partial [Paramuricea clavata]